jgi:hypothetical protein
MIGGKSHMSSQHTDETLLTNYLLGNLTEEEQVEVEDRAFADPGYLRALEATEADLIDSYVGGELSQPDRRKFELRFLSSAQRRSKVEFAWALAAIGAESKAVEVPDAGWRSFMSSFRGWIPPFQWAAGTAALVCVIGSAWLFFQNSAIRSRVAALEAERGAFEVREGKLRQQVSDEQSRAGALTTQLRSRPASAAHEPQVASLVFLPGLVRSQTRVERLVLDPSVQIARLEIQLEARDNFPRFRAELRKRTGEEIMFRSNLVRRRTGAGFEVSFDIPASALDAGEYELTLKGIAADGATQDLGYYYFGVQRR